MPQVLVDRRCLTSAMVQDLEDEGALDGLLGVKTF